mgnify:FL=1
MNKRTSKRNRFITLKSVLGAALILLVVSGTLVGYAEVHRTAQLASSTMQSLKQQCISFNRLVAADRTKSLYWLSDMMLDLSEDLKRDPSLATDDYLEAYVDNLRLSGVALLNENGILEVSGYTRQFREVDWKNSPVGSQFADIATYPKKIYTEQVEVDGEYYDVCALAREDAPGILLGFYQQPSGLITRMEEDLESLLSGLELERSGHYLIAENGMIRVASDTAFGTTEANENELFEKFALTPKNGKLHWVSAGGKIYWGYHSGCENYSIYIYYPAAAVLSSTIAIVAAVMAAYCALCFLYYAVRNQALYENQEKLRQSNQNLTETVQMLKALQTIYFMLFYVNLETGHYDAVYIAPWMKAAIPESGDYDTLRKLFIDRFIVPAFREEIDTHMSIPYIRETLNRQNLSDVRKSFYVDYQAIREDRTPWCRVSATPVDFDESGKPRHILALVQDIDQDKVREADYQAQIINEVNKTKIANNAKTDFLRRISHDIRTPINGIQGYIDMAAKHPENAELQERCRRNISMTLRILLELVNSILDMGDLESNEIILEEKPFDLTALLDGVNTTMLPLAKEKNIHYEVVRCGALPFTHLIGSPRHLSQIIMNLTSNAVKYTNPGGNIRVHTQLISHTEDSVTYAFVCEDNGVGMSEEFQQHVYEPFTQERINARTTYEGIGLGLSIVKKLVDAMNGTITCQSEKGVGTTFRVELTFKLDRRQEAVLSLPEQKADATLNKRNILLVEDNALNMEIAECILTELGAKVTKAWNGKEAVDIFAASAPGHFDLILMDIMMPEMGGREATRSIRAMNRPDAKSVLIMAMSANSLQEDIQKNRNAGMNDHISKPISSDELKKALQECDLKA